MLLILVLIAVALVAALVIGVAMAISLARRCWWWMGPVGATALLLIVTLGVFDVMAAASPAGPAESTPAKRIAAHDQASEGEAPSWTRRKPGELNAAQADAEVTVYAGPSLSLQQCEADLDQKLAAAVEDYIRTEIAPEQEARVRVPLQYIRHNLMVDRHVATKRPFLGLSEDPEMVEIYALVRFDAMGRDHLRELWRESVVRSRMETAGATLAGVLAVLTLAWAVLRRTPKTKYQEANRHVV